MKKKKKKNKKKTFFTSEEHNITNYGLVSNFMMSFLFSLIIALSILVLNCTNKIVGILTGYNYDPYSICQLSHEN